MEALSAVLAVLQLALVPDVKAYWLSNDPTAPAPEPTKKRFQVGSIAERVSNPKRDKPTTCYYFCWNEKDEDGRWQKRKTYVPQAQMSAVWQACKIDKRPYYETLRMIQKSGKPHHTDSPKL